MKAERPKEKPEGVLSEPWPRKVPRLGASLLQIQNYGAQWKHRRGLSTRLFYWLTKCVLSKAQRGLEAVAEDWQHREMSLFYLRSRASLAFYSNVFYLLEDDTEAQDLCGRAADLVQRALYFRQHIHKGKLPGEKEGSYLLDQSFYPYFFSCCRIPHQTQDRIQLTESSQHIIVACRGQLFAVHGLTQLPDVEQLYEMFSEILHEAKPQTYAPGLWTTLDRDAWAALRLTLLGDPMHAQVLALIEGAILWVALEADDSPQDRSEAMRRLSVDGFENRWFDRSQQLIIFANGMAGVNRDHTLLDGHPSMLYVKYLQGKPSHPEASSFASRPVLKKQVLHLELHSQLVPEYQDAKRLWEQTRQEFWMEVRDVAAIGQELCRQLHVNADFVVQAAIHLACLRSFSSFQSVSEAVHMRHTSRGRYETILTLTPSMRAFVSGIDRGEASSALWTLFESAQIAHRDLIRSCKRGETGLLHLSALLQSSFALRFCHVSAEGLSFGKHLVWRDEGFTRSLLCNVTSSHPGYRPGLEMVGYTDTSRSVLGLVYLVKAEQTCLFIKADHESIARGKVLAAALTTAMNDLSGLLRTRLA